MAHIADRCLVQKDCPICDREDHAMAYDFSVAEFEKMRARYYGGSLGQLAWQAYCKAYDQAHRND